MAKPYFFHTMFNTLYLDTEVITDAYEKIRSHTPVPRLRIRIQHHFGYYCRPALEYNYNQLEFYTFHGDGTIYCH